MVEIVKCRTYLQVLNPRFAVLTADFQFPDLQFSVLVYEMMLQLEPRKGVLLHVVLLP